MGQAKQRRSWDERIAQAKQRVDDSPRMTDPTDTLTAFQEALRDGSVKPERCEWDRELYVHLDNPIASLALRTCDLMGGRSRRSESSSLLNQSTVLRFPTRLCRPSGPS